VEDRGSWRKSLTVLEAGGEDEKKMGGTHLTSRRKLVESQK